MRALEDLYNDVRDPATKPRVREVMDAYNAGAFRSAIISTWVAVSLDIVVKIRELADQGDSAAIAWRDVLDNAIATGDKQKLQRVEATLLEDARTQFSFLSEREYVELCRLRDDRHVCAHPAFVEVEKVFEPSAELVRLHLATAVAAVLSQPPTPGRKALERFFAESKGSTWPKSRVDLGVYLRANYLDRGKQSLRENLAQVIIKGVLVAPENDDRISDRLAEAAHALEDVAPELLEQALQRVVTRRFQSGGLPEDQAMRLIGWLGDMTIVWVSIPSASRSGLVAAIDRRPVDDIIADGILSTAQADAQAAEAVEKRLRRISSSYSSAATLSHIIEIQPGPHLWPHALREFTESGAWRDAEERMRGLIIPFAPQMVAKHIEEIAGATLGNDQIRMAAEMPALMERLFTRVRRGPGVLEVWRSFVERLVTAAAGDETNYYAYPGLEERVAGAR